MRLSLRTFGHFAVWLLSFLALPAEAHAQFTPPTPECSPAVTNMNCTIIVDRDSPSSPLTMRMKSGATVTLFVRKRPLDIIQVEVTTTDVALPDPVSAILTAFLPSLAKLQFDTRIINPAAPPSNADFRAFTMDVLPSNPFSDLLKRLARISDRQTAAETHLKAAKTKVDGGAAALRTFQERSINGWASLNFTVEQTTLVTTLIDASSTLQPGGVVAALRVALDEVAKSFAALRAPLTPTEQAQLEALVEKINQVDVNQTRLEAGVKSIEASQATLELAAGIVGRIDGAHAFSFLRTFTQSASEVGRNTSAKITSQDAVSKTTTALATTVMLWSETRWEVSAGAVFSSLENRSFQNAPVIIRGEPQLDSAGKVRTVVTESVTRPSVVPFALTHYRLGETSIGGRRLAALATAGIGINTAYGSADFALGGSVAYRLLVVSLVAHYGRDLRLLNGVESGKELGSSPPALATERFWVWKPALAVSLRVPF
jgi:hypothetical protein